jgi:ribonuclease HII
MRGQFFEKIKSGKRLKVGGKFVSTHRDLSQPHPMPSSWEQRALEVVRAIADHESSQPTPAGEESSIPCPTLDLPLQLGKWVGRSDHGEKEVIFAARVNPDTYLFIELPEMFILRREEAYSCQLKENSILEQLMQAAKNTHNKYKGSKIARNPATGKTEEKFWHEGKTCVVGLDEAGRGAWAGPIMAAAVLVSPASEVPVVQDSKALSAADREKLEEEVKQKLPYGIGSVSSEEIDKIGIDPANRLAFERAVSNLQQRHPECRIDHIIVDGNPIRPGTISFPAPYSCITQGEITSKSIAAASILSKTGRDRLMVQLDQEYPGYGFAEHKGYGTPQHQKALARLGVCPVHRSSYAPVRAHLSPSLGL